MFFRRITSSVWFKLLLILSVAGLIGNLAFYARTHSHLPVKLLGSTGEAGGLAESVDRVMDVMGVEQQRNPRVYSVLRKVLARQTESALDKDAILKIVQSEMNASAASAAGAPKGMEPKVNTAVVEPPPPPPPQTQAAKTMPPPTTAVRFTGPVQLPPCKDTPDGLVGALAAQKATVEYDQLTNANPQMKVGGSWKPDDCQPKQKLAIIIPYRNRWEHLMILLRQLLPMLMRQKLDFTIFVIEQAPPTTFNRGMLMNVGFMEALKHGNYDCFIFHDVDMLPLHDHNMYKCTDNPKHMPSGISKFNYKLPYAGYFGAAVAFTKEQYEKINGNSNLYFGWGGEDDDLLSRIKQKGYIMTRTPMLLGQYDMIKHHRDKGNEVNADRTRLLKSTASRQDEEGLNTCKYIVDKTEKHQVYTWVVVRLNMTQILQK